VQVGDNEVRAALQNKKKKPINLKLRINIKENVSYA
jgi:hypothetical protein